MEGKVPFLFCIFLRAFLGFTCPPCLMNVRMSHKGSSCFIQTLGMKLVATWIPAIPFHCLDGETNFPTYYSLFSTHLETANMLTKGFHTES